MNLAKTTSSETQNEKGYLKLFFLASLLLILFKTPRKEPAVQGRREIIKVVENYWALDGIWAE